MQRALQAPKPHDEGVKESRVRSCILSPPCVEIDNLLLEHLEALRNALRDFRHEFHTESENRMSALDTAMINVKREVAAGDGT